MCPNESLEYLSMHFWLLMISFHVERSLTVNFSWLLSTSLHTLLHGGCFNDLIRWVCSVSNNYMCISPQFFSLGHELHARIMHFPFLAQAGCTSYGSPTGEGGGQVRTSAGLLGGQVCLVLNVHFW